MNLQAGMTQRQRRPEGELGRTFHQRYGADVALKPARIKQSLPQLVKEKKTSRKPRKSEAVYRVYYRV